MHVIAAKAVAFKEAMTPEFKEYQRQVVENARLLASGLARRGYRIVSGGTDTHLLLIDLGPKGITGKDAALALGRAKITVNKNLIPFDTRSPVVTSGIRLGSPAVTTRGMGAEEMAKICELIDHVLSSPEDDRVIGRVREEVTNLVRRFPLYTELIKSMEAEIKEA